jgi:hypothetical protein
MLIAIAPAAMERIASVSRISISVKPDDFPFALRSFLLAILPIIMWD